MGDIQKTKKQLVEELELARGKISDLETIIRHEKEAAEVSTVPDTNVVMIDRNATVRLIKPDVAGSTRGHVSGASFYDYALPEFRQAIRTCFERVLKTGESSRFKSTYEYEDGAQQSFESCVRPVRRGGEIAGAVVISEDVTGGRHADKIPDGERFDPDQYFENLPIMAYNLTFDGKIADCNAMVASTLGYDCKEDLIGKPLIGTIYAPASRGAALRLLEEWKSVGEIKNEELQVITKGGKVLDVILNAATIVAHGDELAHSLSTHLDITDLKRSQAAVLAERDELFHVLAAIRDGVLVVSDTHDLLYVNEVLEETFGPWSGKKCYEYLSMGHAPCQWCSEPEAAFDKPSRGEWLCSKNNRTYEVVGTSIRNPDGSRSRLHVLRDITERKRAEEALSESEEKFRAIVETSVDVTFQVDLDGRVTYVSPSVEGLLGFRSDEIIGQSFSRFLKPSDAAMAVSAFAGNLSAGSFKRREIELPRKDRPPQIIEVTPILWRKNGQIAGVQGTVRDITERKKAEDHLRESEAKFRILFEDAPAAIALVNKDGVIQEANNSLLRLLSIREEEIVGRSFVELAPAFGLAVAENVRDFENRLDESPSKREMTFINRNNIKTTLTVRSSVIRSGDELLGVLYILHDISEQKLAEGALRDELEFLQTLLDTIPNPVFYKGIDQRYTGCNRAFEQFLGLQRSEILGKTVYEVAPKDTADEYFERDRELLRHPGTQIYEWKVRTGTGEVRDVMFSKATFVGSDEKVAGLLGVIIDITDLKKVQAALQLREELYRSRFEQSPIANWEVDFSRIKAYGDALRSTGIHDFRAYFRARPEEVAACGEMIAVHDANVAALELFQCGTIEDLDHLIRQRSRNPVSEAFMEKLISLSEGASSFAGELAVLTAGGQKRFLSLRWVVPPGSAETLSSVLFSALDITHLKQVETELRAAESKLRTYNDELEKTLHDRTERIRQLERQRSASEAHAATGRLAARIAHEINNPLAGIKNSFLLVKRAVPKDHPRYEYVSLIEREIDRIALIVRKTFELYRDEKQVRHEVSAVDCIREVLAISESSLREKGLSAELNAPDKSITASLPAGFLTQVLLNLLRNAIDASEPHGAIAISAEADDGEMVVRVKDEGRGISDEDAQHIFEPFFTTKGNTEPGGLGLGLAVSRSMVEAVGGSITFETCPGKGTTFTVRVPTGRGDKEVLNGREG